METIMSYIDNIFSSYPDTPEVRKAREDLLSIMEDKYNELKAEGKSENEAIGVVISEFGNMEEIAAELNIAKETPKSEDVEDIREKEKFTLEQARNYIHTQKDFGIKIAIGVMLCILSPITACFLDPLAEAGFLPVRVTDTIGALALFAMVAIAVGLFITSGISNNKYENMKKKQIVLDYSTRQLITEMADKQNRSYGNKIAVGVILCILSVVPPMVMDAIFGGSDFFWISDMTGVTLFLFVAIAVYMFITVGMEKDAYDLVLGNGEYTAQKYREKHNSVIALIGAIYWPVVVCIYLGWSFITMDWEITWITWPIAGVLFGAIAAVVAVVEGMKK